MSDYQMIFNKAEMNTIIENKFLEKKYKEFLQK